MNESMGLNQQPYQTPPPSIVQPPQSHSILEGGNTQAPNIGDLITGGPEHNIGKVVCAGGDFVPKQASGDNPEQNKGKDPEIDQRVLAAITAAIHTPPENGEPVKDAATIAAEKRAYEFDLRLVINFEDYVDQLNLSEIAVPRDPQKPIAKMERFGLTPIIPLRDDWMTTQEAAGTAVIVRGDIETTYSTTINNDIQETEESDDINSDHPQFDGLIDDGRPYLDTGAAIGLTYDNKLIAVAGAQSNSEGHIEIVQIQDVTGVRKSSSGKEFYRTGLHSGLMWRDTLVAAWEAVARKNGSDTIIIIPNGQTQWSDVRDAEVPHYDLVAQRRGFLFYSKWQKSVEPES